MSEFLEIKQPDISPLDLCAYQFGATLQRLELRALWLANAVFSAELFPLTPPLRPAPIPDQLKNLNELELGGTPQYIDFSKSRSPETGPFGKFRQREKSEFDKICTALRAALPPLQILTAFSPAPTYQELRKTYTELGGMLDRIGRLTEELFNYPLETEEWCKSDFQENFIECIAPLFSEGGWDDETPEEHSERVRKMLSDWASKNTKQRASDILGGFHSLYQRSNLKFPIGWYQTGRDLEVEELNRTWTLPEIILPNPFRVPAGQTNRFQILQSLGGLGFRGVPDPQSGEESHVQDRLFKLHRDLIQKRPKFETAAQSQPDKVICGGDFQLTLNITKRLLVREGFEPVNVEPVDLEIVKRFVNNPRMIASEVTDIGTGGTNTKFSSTVKTAIVRANKKYFTPLKLKVVPIKSQKLLTEIEN